MATSSATVLLVLPKCREKAQSQLPSESQARPLAPNCPGFPFKLPSVFMVTKGLLAGVHMIRIKKYWGVDEEGIERREKNLVA